MMATPLIIPVLLSGGAGTRLWPYSRAAKPKQFLSFGTQHTLIQETVLRCSGALFDNRPIVVSGESQRFLIAEDMANIKVKADIILEPMRRDSCAAVAVGCLQALKRSADALVLVLAADHLIPDVQAFEKAVAAALPDAVAGYLTTFGIKPTSPATGYGYIRPGSLLREKGSARLEKFVEKPDPATAAKYVSEGYLWNSGNFLFSAQSFIDELKLYAPEVHDAVKASLNSARQDVDFLWLEKEAFARSPQISVDYAVMEKTRKSAVYAVDYEWRDIGLWDAVHELLPHDEFQNAISGRSVILNGKNNLVHSTNMLTALSDVDDLIVVVTDEAVMISKRGKSENVKPLVAHLQQKKFKEAD
jgi:mannose-1-phosphate guanylyltransferase / mannose-6-phosphate isomerase